MKTLLSLILIIIFNLSVFPQSETKVDANNYKSVVDSLSSQIKNLTETKLLFKKQIDSLKSQSNNLSVKIDNEFLEIENLYTKKFGNDTGRKIYNKHIWKGMTEKMLQASWGKPDKIDKSVKNWGTFTQWYYGDVTFFFRDRILTDWEEKKN